MMLSEEREQALMALITEAARNGMPSPTNAMICGALGYKSVGSACEAVQSLERKGLIEVERGDNSRIIRLRSNRTAASSNRPSAVVAVERAPCFWCGVRNDIGCRHGGRHHVAATAYDDLAGQVRAGAA